ncbi:MAG: winged helix-turn-helix transcriptional regulator [Rhodospirillaceae bacterium]|jgi:DNA-binding transcriptional ArsR family regulator|nr:winged helix-turn-helix transcriptional regulator [Rhodospirillaceae bacterium]MBT3492592.1 winged helix-turn-helix transcriptional regulator [Rhodospirillaceae bacterium]MBT3782461.1 winged helix-turn-helix transcriptional regulator [Rhodospirillaceae bacterium]MBT3978590.1 winged helix-turn-helix transcriptional regulator [Rhodospirillaceae bacterium]MBT4170779.1 winged helix-turn-helix transcriptional regulator [Rhodospirillaceae bacterium]
MSVNQNLATIAALLGEESRASMIAALMDGRALTARELAVGAGITPQTASFHLAKLCTGGLLNMLRQGRHNYYRIAGPDVAAAIQALQLIAPKAVQKPIRLDDVRLARTCYKHLAGRLGVAVAGALEDRKLLRRHDNDFELTPAGEGFFTELGIAPDSLRGGQRARRRQFARQCLDWSERRPHLGGALGAALLDQFLARKWLRRVPGSRAVRLSKAGAAQLQERLGITDWDR